MIGPTATPRTPLAVGGTPVDLLAGVDGALYVLMRESIVRIAVP
jgi:hypothetical protein